MAKGEDLNDAMKERISDFITEVRKEIDSVKETANNLMESVTGKTEKQPKLN